MVTGLPRGPPAIGKHDGQPVDLAGRGRTGGSSMSSVPIRTTTGASGVFPPTQSARGDAGGAGGQDRGHAPAKSGGLPTQLLMLRVSPTGVGTIGDCPAILG